MVDNCQLINEKQWLEHIYIKTETKETFHVNRALGEYIIAKNTNIYLPRLTIDKVKLWHIIVVITLFYKGKFMFITKL